jgi:hypothetical protein
MQTVFIVTYLSWLNNFSEVYLVQVSLLLIGQQGLGHFFRAPTTLSALQAAKTIQLMQTRNYRKCVSGSVKYIKYIKNQPRCLFRPRSVHICHQKPNPALETVRFKAAYYRCVKN